MWSKVVKQETVKLSVPEIQLNWGSICFPWVANIVHLIPRFRESRELSWPLICLTDEWIKKWGSIKLSSVNWTPEEKKFVLKMMLKFLAFRLTCFISWVFEAFGNNGTKFVNRYGLCTGISVHHGCFLNNTEWVNNWRFLTRLLVTGQDKTKRASCWNIVRFWVWKESSQDFTALCAEV